MSVAVCSACTNPQLDALNTDLAGGIAQRTVAKRYGLSLPVVNRHRQNHLPASLVPVTTTGELLIPGTLLERLEKLASGAEAIQAIALQSGHAQTALAAIRETRATLELVAKITGQLNERPVVIVNLDTSQEWQAMRTTMLQILHRHPDALAEVRDVLRLEPPA